MPDLQSCGFFIYRSEPRLSFLLMQHPTRWDLPKGHVDPGETEMECAIRELLEETGITESQIEIDEHFRFDNHYTVAAAKYNYEPQQKQLSIFLAKLTQPFVKIELTEHDGYRWFDWQPPHNIQARTINPLLDAVEEYWDPSKVG